jgi:sensor histidine kinase YesM
VHSRLRLVVGVSAAWILAAVVSGAQAALGSTLRAGAQPVPLSAAVQSALVQMLPWIPVTLAVVALTIRYPLSRERWRVHLPLHLLAAAVLAFVANILVVLGYWATMGQFRGLPTLAREGAYWATARFHIALLIYAAVLAITQGIQYYQRTRDRELRVAKLEGQLARAHVQALNAQIRPHFLFNALHTIGQLWRSGRSDDADAMLDDLGSLFHKVQSSTSRFEVPLAEELDLVREYLAIEEARFPDRLRARVHAAPETLDCLVPPLILQPLVENAVRHGISAVSTAGTIEVTAKLDAGRLSLAVRDDGPGMEHATPQPGSGTGLRNTRERLAQLYGDRAALRIVNGDGGGTTVRIELPANGHPVASD